MDDLLVQIQQRQYSDKPQAERLLLEFIREIFPLDVVAVELRPLAVSLNSFNGFLTLASGCRMFFKTHTEPDAVVSEFYNGAVLASAGYPIIESAFSSVEAGRQLLIYEMVEDPSVFDVAQQIEDGDHMLLDALTEAQRDSDRHLLDIYVDTLASQSSTEAAAAPVHQLFYHRLTGRRMCVAYGPGTVFTAPDGEHPMEHLRRLTWTINGQRYAESLDDVITRGVRLLTPARPGPSVIGHGDAHNGNVFFRKGEGLVFFDPAFGGRHDPLLDLAKPLFHNTFAMWMYYPELKNSELTLDFRIIDGTIHVEHDYRLPVVRRMFLNSKITNTVTPLMVELRRRDWLAPDWRARLKAALFCCPLLTKDLSNRSTFPAAIGALGLAFAMEMGAESSGERSVVDQALDDVEAALR